jgi:SAM-dependent methyltransferase
MASVNPPPAAAAFVDGPLPPATLWETVAATRWGHYTTEVVQDLVSAACALAGPPGAALEVGCEGGRWTRMLARKGWSMTCTDVDATSLAICQDRIPGANCILVSPDATRLPCENGSVRMLLCLEVFSVMDSDWFASEASRVLDDQGVLVGVTLNRRSARGAFVRLKEYLRRESRFYNASYPEWRRRMGDGGFDIVLERGYCWFPFRRASNSLLVPGCVWLERRLGLSRLPSLSPWVAFVARKRTVGAC